MKAVQCTVVRAFSVHVWDYRIDPRIAELMEDKINGPRDGINNSVNRVSGPRPAQLFCPGEGWRLMLRHSDSVCSRTVQ